MATTSAAAKALLALCLAAGVSAAGAGEAVVTVHGTANRVEKLGVPDLQKLGSTKVHVRQENDAEADFDCVGMQSILEQAGVAFGKALRGAHLSDFLVAQAHDGYAAVFALPELDAAFTDKKVWLCFGKDGAALPEAEGPLRLVVPDEKRHARWVRQVTDLWIKSDKPAAR